MDDWSKRFMEVCFKLNQMCVQQDLHHRSCILMGRMECWLLNRLAQLEGPLCMNDLANYLNVSHSRVTRIVDNLVKKDCVRRYPSKEDRRRWYCEITDTGRTTAEQGKAENIAMFQRLIKRLPQDQLALIYNSLHIYIDAMDSVLTEEEK